MKLQTSADKAQDKHKGYIYTEGNKLNKIRS